MVKKVLMSLAALCLTSNLFSEECNLSHKILYGIALTEKHSKRDTGYPFLISFNNYSDFLRVKTDLKDLGMIILDNRTIDCKDKSTCSAVTEYLVKNNIVNIDLGAFQHCYKWNTYAFDDYFDLEKSYMKTCQIVSEEVKNHGFTWKAISRYHNVYDKYNVPYSQKLQKNILKAYPELAIN